MSRIDIECWNPRCHGRLILNCRDHDQAVYCLACKEVRSFVNLGSVICHSCRHLNRVPINNWDLVAQKLQCENCQVLFADTLAMRVYHLGQWMKDEIQVDQELNGCNRGAFEGGEEEAKHGKAALTRLAPGGRKSLYIDGPRKIYITVPGLPIEYLRTYHVSCNFQAYAGENTKFSGTLASFARPNLLVSGKSVFDWLLGDWKVQTVWFASTSARNDFMTVPLLAAWQSRFCTE